MLESKILVTPATTWNCDKKTGKLIYKKFLTKKREKIDSSFSGKDLVLITIQEKEDQILGTATTAK